MKKITQVLNSPLKIAAFAVCVVLIIGIIAFASITVGANVNANKTIGMEKGVAVALADAGFKTEEVTNLTAHYDSEDGVAVYEIDFTANGYEYDYVVKASDGKIIEAQRENIKVPETSGNQTTEGNSSADTSGDSQTAQSSSSQSGSSQSSNSSAASAGSANTQGSQSQTNSASDPSSNYIGVDKAKSIALSNAGLSASSVTFTKAKLDRDDGVAVYDVEFYTSDMEYEYEINATTGEIRERDSEHRDFDDDWDD